MVLQYMFLSLYDEVTNVLCLSLLSHDRYQYGGLILSSDTGDYRSSSIWIRKSMINIGDVTVLPSMNRSHTTNTPRTIVTTPTQVVDTNTSLKASIGNKADYYPTFSIFLYLQNNLQVLRRFDANYCIILSVILTHSHSQCPVLHAHASIFFNVFPLLHF